MPDHIDLITEQWKRERPDVDTAALATFARLFRAAHLADAPLTAELARHGLERGWFDVLAALRRAGEPFELNPTDLMEATMLSSAGVTKRLDRLADAGLVRRRPDPGDRRGTLVGLTARGMRAVESALDAHTANEERLLAPLRAAERKRLDAALRSLLAALEPLGRSL